MSYRNNDLFLKYKESIDTALNDYNFYDLTEYTADSQIGCDIAILYKQLVEKVLGKTFHVYADEISAGKYQVVFNPDDSIPLTLYSKGNYTKENVADAIMDFIIIPYLRWEKMGDAS